MSSFSPFKALFSLLTLLQNESKLFQCSPVNSYLLSKKGRYVGTQLKSLLGSTTQGADNQNLHLQILAPHHTGNGHWLQTSFSGSVIKILMSGSCKTSKQWRVRVLDWFFQVLETVECRRIMAIARQLWRSASLTHLLKGGSAKSRCSGLCPVRFQIFPWVKTPKPTTH